MHIRIRMLFGTILQDISFFVVNVLNSATKSTVDFSSLKKSLKLLVN